MERVELEAQSRVVRGKQVKQLRAEQWIPSVVYGPDMPAKAIQIEERDLSKALRQAGSTTLIDLNIDDEGQPYVVLAREIQRDIITGRLQHVDFYQVRLTEKVKTTPRLEFVGESPALQSGRAVLIQGMTELEVECLPTDLISSITVDVSSLENMGDSVTVSDLSIPSTVTVLADPDDVVVSVVATRMAAEIEAMEEEEEELIPEELMPEMEIVEEEAPPEEEPEVEE
jgi:large subunit ribosomal protein L25